MCQTRQGKVREILFWIFSNRFLCEFIVLFLWLTDLSACWAFAQTFSSATFSSTTVSSLYLFKRKIGQKVKQQNGTRKKGGARQVCCCILISSTHTHTLPWKVRVRSERGRFQNKQKERKTAKVSFFFLFLLYLLKKKKLINIKHALKRTKKNPNELQLI